MCRYSVYTVVLLLFLLGFISKHHSKSTNPSKLLDLSAQSFRQILQSGRTCFVYFGKHVNPGIEAFLEQLEMSAHALEDYGIMVGKLNCSVEEDEPYCSREEVMKKAHLFRGAEVLRSFDVDTVFDVNAIVSHVLFSVLFNEVRYVHTPAELLAVERAARGTRDVVMGHIQVLGLPEHRALMEAAFVYGTKYQFVQTTGAPLLKHMGVADPASVPARLWFLHCSAVTHRSEPCPHTLMRKPLTTINIHTFLQLMEAPLLVEASVDPEEVNVVFSHLNVPVLFLFAQSETMQLDRDTAQSVARRLRGEVGVVLIHRSIGMDPIVDLKDQAGITDLSVTESDLGQNQSTPQSQTPSEWRLPGVPDPVDSGTATTDLPSGSSWFQERSISSLTSLSMEKKEKEKSTWKDVLEKLWNDGDDNVTIELQTLDVHREPVATPGPPGTTVSETPVLVEDLKASTASESPPTRKRKFKRCDAVQTTTAATSAATSAATTAAIVTTMLQTLNISESSNREGKLTNKKKSEVTIQMERDAPQRGTRPQSPPVSKAYLCFMVVYILVVFIFIVLAIIYSSLRII